MPQRNRPVLCLVDDAQWLDRATAQTLAFVARRLDAEQVGIVFAVREPIAQFDGLPELILSGLAPEDARHSAGIRVDRALWTRRCESGSLPRLAAIRSRFLSYLAG